MVQGTAVAAGKVRVVMKNTGFANDAGLPFAVFLDHPALFRAGLVVLPQRLIKLGHPAFSALAVVLVGEMRTKGAAAGFRGTLVDAWAAASKDAGPT